MCAVALRQRLQRVDCKQKTKFLQRFYPMTLHNMDMNQAMQMMQMLNNNGGGENNNNQMAQMLPMLMNMMGNKNMPAGEGNTQTEDLNARIYRMINDIK